MVGSGFEKKIKKEMRNESGLETFKPKKHMNRLYNIADLSQLIRVFDTSTVFSFTYKPWSLRGKVVSIDVQPSISKG